MQAVAPLSEEAIPFTRLVGPGFNSQRRHMTLMWSLIIILIMGIIMAVFTILCGYEYCRAANYVAESRKWVELLEEEYDAIISRKLLAYGHIPIEESDRE